MSHIALSNLSKSDRDANFHPMDSRSDKSILYETQVDVHSPNSRQEDQDGIVRTDTVSVMFGGRKGKEDVERGVSR